MPVHLTHITGGRETYPLFSHRLRCTRRVAFRASSLFAPLCWRPEVVMPVGLQAEPEQSLFTALLLDNLWVQAFIALWLLTLIAIGFIYAHRLRKQRTLLQRQGQYFRALIEHSADLITVIDQTGTIRYQSPSCTQLLGYGADALVGTSIFSIIHPNEHTPIKQAVATQDKLDATTLRVQHKDGMWRMLSITGQRIADMEEAPVFVFNARDVTDHLAAEQEIASQQAYLREVIDTIPHLIFAKDRAGRFVLANQAIANSLARDVDSILGKTDPELSIKPEEAQRFRRDDLEVIESGVEKRILDEPATGIDGKTRWYRAIKRPLFDEQGEVKQVLGVSFEITELKEQEEQLRRLLNERTVQQAELIRVNAALHSEIAERKAAEQRLAAVLDTVGEGIITLNTDNQIVMVNAAIETMWGYGREELEGQDVTMLMPEPYRARHNKAFARHLKTGKSQMLGRWVEVEGLRKDGHVFPLEAYVSKTKVGAKTLYTAAVRDITARKQAKQERDAQRAFLNQVIDTSPNLINITDAQGHFSLVNKAMADLFDSTVAALIGTPKSDLPLAKDELDLCVSEEDNILETQETVIFTERLTPPDGTAYWFQTVKTPIRLPDDTVEILSISTDITDLVKKEEELRSKRTFLRKVIDAHPHFIFAKDSAGRYTLANQRVAEHYDLPIQNVIGKTHEEMGTPDITLALLQTAEADIFTTQQPLYETEALFDEATETTSWFSVTKLPMQDAAGNVAHVLSLIIDITDQKQNEQYLRTAKQEAEELASLKTAFLANMSHEIRTPLTGIIGFASVLTNEVSAEQQELTHLIELNGQRLLQTLNSVLDLSMLESGTLHIDPQPIDLADEIQQKVALLSPLAEKKGLGLTAHAPSEPIGVLLDVGCFNRVLDNIIGNALKFTEEGHVRVTAQADDSHVTIEIADTGVGISEGFLPYLFDEFRQENMGLTRNHEGSGLGLAITKRLVDLMDGTIHVKSVLGEGTQVTLTFNRVGTTNNGTSSSQDLSALPVNGKGARILVAEDNTFAQGLFRHLVDAGYHVDIAENADKAYTLLAKYTFDLALLDIHLGEGQSGVDILQHIRHHSTQPDLPVAAVTAYALPGDRERYIGHGFDAYLSKPFTWHQLLRLVQHLQHS